MSQLINLNIMRSKYPLLSFLILLLLFSVKISAQVGINTTNPMNVFHIDGGKDNSDGEAISVQQQSNDFIVTETGSVGVGTIVPLEKLDINGKVRIQDIPDIEDKTHVLATDDDGVIHKFKLMVPEYESFVWGKNTDYPGYNVLVDMDISLGQGRLATWRIDNTTLKVPEGKGGDYMISFTTGTKLKGALNTATGFFTYLKVNNNFTEAPGVGIPASTGYTSAVFSLNWSETVTLKPGDQIKLQGLIYGGAAPSSGVVEYFKVSNFTVVSVPHL